MYRRGIFSDELPLHSAMKKFKFSMRGMNKILKVARTIADLEQSINVNHFHLAEALSYRVKSLKSN